MEEAVTISSNNELINQNTSICNDQNEILIENKDSSFNHSYDRDYLFSKPCNIVVQFRLPAGCYATSLLREVLANNEII